MFLDNAETQICPRRIYYYLFIQLELCSIKLEMKKLRNIREFFYRPCSYNIQEIFVKFGLQQIDYLLHLQSALHVIALQPIHIIFIPIILIYIAPHSLNHSLHLSKNAFTRKVSRLNANKSKLIPFCCNSFCFLVPKQLKFTSKLQSDEILSLPLRI